MAFTFFEWLYFLYCILSIDQCNLRNGADVYNGVI